MVKVENLTKQYNGKTVLNIPNLEIPKGQSFGLVGNNGAGKTTFFNLILDLIRPTTGRILNNNIEVNKSEDWKSFTSAFIDESFLIGYLTPEEYFQFIADLRDVDKKEVALLLEKYKDFFNDEILNQKKYLRDLSKGNQKKVGLVASFIGNPEVIILDEPFSNLDPTTQIRLKKLLKQISEKKEVSLLISSHDLGHISEVTDRIVILDKGNIVKDIETTPETLKELEHFFAV